jgi:hypothetical protein
MGDLATPDEPRDDDTMRVGVADRKAAREHAAKEKVRLKKERKEAEAAAAEAAAKAKAKARIDELEKFRRGGRLPMDWKVVDVSDWLETIQLPMHAEAFKAHSVNGKMLLTLSDQDLYSTLSVVSPLHRKKLLMEISALRKSYLSM